MRRSETTHSNLIQTKGANFFSALTETIREKNRAQFLLPSPLPPLHSQRGESTHNYDIKGYSVAQSLSPTRDLRDGRDGLLSSVVIVGTTGCC